MNNIRYAGTQHISRPILAALERMAQTWFAARFGKPAKSRDELWFAWNYHLDRSEG